MSSSEMKDNDLSEQVIRQRVAGLAEHSCIARCRPLDPDWEGLVVGGDEPREKE